MRELLKSVRENCGLTQEQVAIAIDCSVRMYRFIESGQREGKGWLWDRLEDLFKVDQRELRSVTKEKSQAS